MSEPVKAAPVPPYATLISVYRRPAFKTHNTLGQVKNSLVSGDWFEGQRVRRGEVMQGTFRCDITVYQLDPCQHEYIPWVEIKADTPRSDYPMFLPTPRR